MLNAAIKDAVFRVLPRVTTPAQYAGGELNSVPKDHRQVRGKLCLCFPDTYSLGTSHHGFQVLYSTMNADPQWACERAFTPWLDMRGGSSASTACPSTASRPSRRCAISMCFGFTPAVRGQLRQHSHDARPGRHPALGCHGPHAAPIR